MAIFAAFDNKVENSLRPDFLPGTTFPSLVQQEICVRDKMFQIDSGP